MDIQDLNPDEDKIQLVREGRVAYWPLPFEEGQRGRLRHLPIRSTYRSKFPHFRYLDRMEKRIQFAFAIVRDRRFL